jgi:hypothetical protein
MIIFINKPAVRSISQSAAPHTSLQHPDARKKTAVCTGTGLQTVPSHRGLGQKIHVLNTHQIDNRLTYRLSMGSLGILRSKRILKILNKILPQKPHGFLKIYQISDVFLPAMLMCIAKITTVNNSGSKLNSSPGLQTNSFYSSKNNRRIK